MGLQVGAVPGENDVVFLVHQPGGQSVGRAAVKGDEHVAVLLVEAAHENGQVAAFIAPDIPHPQRAAEAGGGVVDPLRCPAHPLQNGLGIQQEGLSRRGQADGPGAAVKEGAAQSFFQKMDLLGHGGLGNVVLLGGLGEAAGLRRRHEILQLIPVHKPSYRYKISFSYFIIRNTPL